MRYTPRFRARISSSAVRASRARLERARRLVGFRRLPTRVRVSPVLGPPSGRARDDSSRLLRVFRDPRDGENRRGSRFTSADDGGVTYHRRAARDGRANIVARTSFWIFRTAPIDLSGTRVTRRVERPTRWRRLRERLM